MSTFQSSFQALHQCVDRGVARLRLPALIRHIIGMVDGVQHESGTSSVSWRVSIMDQAHHQYDGWCEVRIIDINSMLVGVQYGSGTTSVWWRVCSMHECH